MLNTEKMCNQMGIYFHFEDRKELILIAQLEKRDVPNFLERLEMTINKFVDLESQFYALVDMEIENKERELHEMYGERYIPFESLNHEYNEDSSSLGVVNDILANAKTRNEVTDHDSRGRDDYEMGIF